MVRQAGHWGHLGRGMKRLEYIHPIDPATARVAAQITSCTTVEIGIMADSRKGTSKYEFYQNAEATELRDALKEVAEIRAQHDLQRKQLVLGVAVSLNEDRTITYDHGHIGMWVRVDKNNIAPVEFYDLVTTNQARLG